MKTVYIGKEGSGKTLLLGQHSYECVLRNAKLAARGYTVRPLVSNIAYTPQFVEFARSKGVPIKYWRDIDELDKLTECDLFIDEVGAYFDSRSYADLPLVTRLWLAQAQKLGVHIYAGAQDWAQIDVSFRRLVNKLYDVKKVIGSRRPSRTFPASKIPWCLVFIWRITPDADSNSASFKSAGIIDIFPDFMFARGAHFRRFDTNARIEDGDPPPLKKVVRHWIDPETGKPGYTRVRYI